MKYLFDTDHLSILLRRNSAEHNRLWNRIDQYDEEDFAFSIVSFHEQLMGCHSYITRNSSASVVRGYELMNDLLALYCPARILPYNSDAHTQFEHLRQQKLKIGTMDLRIAAIALVEGATLLTRNVSDFSRVPHLPLDDWTRP